jgi:hypothetical protein
MVALPIELLSKVLLFHLAFDKNDFFVKGFGLSVPKIAKWISVDKPVQEFFNSFVIGLILCVLQL